MSIKKLIFAIVISALALTCYAEISPKTPAETQQSTQINSEAGGRMTWETQADGVYFSLTQILPEQLQAHYVNRGFTIEEIAPYTSSCVYMTVLRNDNASGPIHFISNNWLILQAGKQHPLVSVDEWVNRLTESNIKKSAIVAFRWGQFPHEQVYEPGGDWNQGMFSVGLPPETEFDVVARWDIDSKQFETKLEGVRCAK
jgi:hypothetical protein